MSFYIKTGNSLVGDHRGESWTRRYGIQRTAQESRRASCEFKTVGGRREHVKNLYISNWNTRRSEVKEPSVRSKLLVTKHFSYFDHFECYRR